MLRVSSFGNIFGKFLKIYDKTLRSCQNLRSVMSKNFEAQKVNLKLSKLMPEKLSRKIVIPAEFRNFFRKNY